MDHFSKAFFWSLEGLKAAWEHEIAFRQEVVAAFILIPMAFWVGKSALSRAVLIFCTLLVIVVELLNSAVEAAIDRIGSEQHPLSARAKNLGSAAVFTAMCTAGIVWGLLIFSSQET